MTDLSDTEKTKSIDEEVFVALIVKHDRRVCGFVKSLLPMDTAADDLVQEVSVVAWQKFRTFRYSETTPDEEFVRWLFTIAKFQVMNERKKRSRRKELVPFDDSLVEELASLQIERSGYFEDRRRALAGCIGKLSSKDQETIRRRYALDQPISVIADYLGRTQVTAYQTIAKIRMRLLNCVKLTLQREGTP